jgi:hypothetical protein
VFLLLPTLNDAAERFYISTGVPHQIAMDPVCVWIRRAAAVLRWLAQKRTTPLESQNALSAGVAVLTQDLQGAVGCNART